MHRCTDAEAEIVGLADPARLDAIGDVELAEDV